MSSTMVGNGPGAPGPACELCGGTGWRFVSGDQKRVTRCGCRCVSVDGKVDLLLPPLLRPARLSDFSQSIVAAVQRWLEAPAPGLLLTGSTGTSKTWLAAALVRVLVESGKKVGFKRAADLYADLRATFNRPDVDERWVMHEFAAVEFLVLDDIAAGSLSDHERRSTLQLLDTRSSYLRPTIVTSNLDLEAIARVMDDRIASRLGSLTIMALTGSDRRAERAQRGNGPFLITHEGVANDE